MTNLRTNATVARIDVKTGATWQPSPVYNLTYTVDALSFHGALLRAQLSGREYRVISR